MNRRGLVRSALGELIRAAAVVAYALGTMAVVTSEVHCPRWLGARWWADAAAIGLTAAIGLALCMPVRALATRGRQSGAAPVLRLVVVGAAAAGVAALAAWWRIHAARAAIIPRIDDLPWEIGLRFEDEAWTLLIAGAGLWLVAVLWAIAGVVWARRHARSPVVAATIAGAMMVACITAEGLVRSAAGYLGYREGCGVYPGIVIRRYESFAEAGEPILSMCWWVLAAAALGSVAVLALARRERHGPPPSRRSLIAAAGLFAAGLAAYAATRGAAHDAHHPPPLWEIDARMDFAIGKDQMAALLPAGRCDHGYVAAPLLVRDAKGQWWVDGLRMSGDAEVVAILSAKRDLWKQVQPNKPFPGLLQTVIAPATPLAEAAAVFDIARRVGFTSIETIEAVSGRPWPSRTLGDIPYRPRGCTVKIERPLSLEGTWEQLVRAAER